MIELKYQNNIDNLFELPENIITIILERLRKELNSLFSMDMMRLRFGDHDLSDNWLQIKREFGGLIILLLFDNFTYNDLYRYILNMLTST